MPFPLVLGCNRPLVGVDAENPEVVQKTPHPFFLLSPAEPAPPTSSPNITHFGSLVSSMYESRGCSSGSGNRYTRLWLSRRSLTAFLEGVNPPSCAISRSWRCGRVRPAYRNVVRSRHNNARLGCTRHPLAHVFSRAHNRKALYVLWFLLWVG